MQKTESPLENFDDNKYAAPIIDALRDEFTFDVKRNGDRWSVKYWLKGPGITASFEFSPEQNRQSYRLSYTGRIRCRVSHGYKSTSLLIRKDGTMDLDKAISVIRRTFRGQQLTNKKLAAERRNSNLTGEFENTPGLSVRPSFDEAFPISMHIDRAFTLQEARAVARLFNHFEKKRAKDDT